MALDDNEEKTNVKYAVVRLSDAAVVSIEYSDQDVVIILTNETNGMSTRFVPDIQ